MSEHDHETFQSADSGASLTFPQQAGTIRKNGFIVIKNRPCKVVDVSTSKTGKHGHAKCNFTAVDIFTGKKYEDMMPSSHNCDVPNISRSEFTLLDINEEGFVTLMAENGDTREDLTLPKGTDDSEKLAAQLKEQFAGGNELIVSVLKSMGEEMINSFKAVNP
ncbi:eukaryotic initiation factor [Scenedesmus sp. NREL 46B-D3]|nr:eukaryotic initiation factor [Scenedesmus sp. NREL 46B-D3]